MQATTLLLSGPEYKSLPEEYTSGYSSLSRILYFPPQTPLALIHSSMDIEEYDKKFDSGHFIR